MVITGICFLGSVVEMVLATVRLVWVVLVLLLEGRLESTQLIARKSLMDFSWESHMLVGKSLSAADKKFMVRVILSSGITLG